MEPNPDYRKLLVELGELSTKEFISAILFDDKIDYIRIRDIVSKVSKVLDWFLDVSLAVDTGTKEALFFLRQSLPTMIDALLRRRTTKDNEMDIARLLVKTSHLLALPVSQDILELCELRNLLLLGAPRSSNYRYITSIEDIRRVSKSAAASNTFYSEFGRLSTAVFGNTVLNFWPDEWHTVLRGFKALGHYLQVWYTKDDVWVRGQVVGYSRDSEEHVMFVNKDVRCFDDGLLAPFPESLNGKYLRFNLHCTPHDWVDMANRSTTVQVLAPITYTTPEECGDKQLQFSASADVGLYLRVWWSNQSRYFYGRVVHYNPKTKCHSIHYENDLQKVYDMAHKDYELLFPPSELFKQAPVPLSNNGEDNREEHEEEDIPAITNKTERVKDKKGKGADGTPLSFSLEQCKTVAAWHLKLLDEQNILGDNVGTPAESTSALNNDNTNNMNKELLLAAEEEPPICSNNRNGEEVADTLRCSQSAHYLSSSSSSSSSLLASSSSSSSSSSSVVIRPPPNAISLFAASIYQFAVINSYFASGGRRFMFQAVLCDQQQMTPTTSETTTAVAATGGEASRATSHSSGATNSSSSSSSKSHRAKVILLNLELIYQLRLLIGSVLFRDLVWEAKESVCISLSRFSDTELKELTAEQFNNICHALKDLVATVAINCTADGKLIQSNNSANGSGTADSGAVVAQLKNRYGGNMRNSLEMLRLSMAVQMLQCSQLQKRYFGLSMIKDVLEVISPTITSFVHTRTIALGGVVRPVQELTGGASAAVSAAQWRPNVQPLSKNSMVRDGDLVGEEEDQERGQRRGGGGGGGQSCSINASVIDSWLMDHQVVEVLFLDSGSLHQDLASRAVVVLVYLAHRKILTERHVELVWLGSVRGAHEAVSKVLHQLLLVLVPVLEAPLRYYILSLMRRVPLCEYSEQLLVFVRRFTAEAMKVMSEAEKRSVAGGTAVKDSRGVGGGTGTGSSHSSTHDNDNYSGHGVGGSSSSSSSSSSSIIGGRKGQVVNVPERQWLGFGLLWQFVQESDGDSSSKNFGSFETNNGAIDNMAPTVPSKASTVSEKSSSYSQNCSSSSSCVMVIDEGLVSLAVDLMVDMLRKEFQEERGQVMLRCLNNVQMGVSVPVSLLMLRKTLSLYPSVGKSWFRGLSLAMTRGGSSSSSSSAASKSKSKAQSLDRQLDMLLKEHAMLDIIFADLERYHLQQQQRDRERAKERSAGATSTQGLSLTLPGSYTANSQEQFVKGAREIHSAERVAHLRGVTERLEFLKFIVSRSNIKLNEAQTMCLWRALGEPNSSISISEDARGGQSEGGDNDGPSAVRRSDFNFETLDRLFNWLDTLVSRESKPLTMLLFKMSRMQYVDNSLSSSSSSSSIPSFATTSSPFAFLAPPVATQLEQSHVSTTFSSPNDDSSRDDSAAAAGTYSCFCEGVLVRLFEDVIVRWAHSSRHIEALSRPAVASLCFKLFLLVNITNRSLRLDFSDNGSSSSNNNNGSSGSGSSGPGIWVRTGTLSGLPLLWRIAVDGKNAEVASVATNLLVEMHHRTPFRSRVTETFKTQFIMQCFRQLYFSVQAVQTPPMDNNNRSMNGADNNVDGNQVEGGHAEDGHAAATDDGSGSTTLALKTGVSWLDDWFEDNDGGACDDRSRSQRIARIVGALRQFIHRFYTQPAQLITLRVAVSHSSSNNNSNNEIASPSFTMSLLSTDPISTLKARIAVHLKEEGQHSLTLSKTSSSSSSSSTGSRSLVAGIAGSNILEKLLEKEKNGEVITVAHAKFNDFDAITARVKDLSAAVFPTDSSNNYKEQKQQQRLTSSTIPPDVIQPETLTSDFVVKVLDPLQWLSDSSSSSSEGPSLSSSSSSSSPPLSSSNPISQGNPSVMFSLPPSPVAALQQSSSSSSSYLSDQQHVLAPYLRTGQRYTDQLLEILDGHVDQVTASAATVTATGSNTSFVDLSAAVWAVLQAMPVHTELYQELRDLKMGSGDFSSNSSSTPSSLVQLFDATCPYRLLYSLQIVEESLLLEDNITEGGTGLLLFSSSSSSSLPTTCVDWAVRFFHLGGPEHFVALLRTVQERISANGNSGSTVIIGSSSSSPGEDQTTSDLLYSRRYQRSDSVTGTTTTTTSCTTLPRGSIQQQQQQQYGSHCYAVSRQDLDYMLLAMLSRILHRLLLMDVSYREWQSFPTACATATAAPISSSSTLASSSSFPKYGITSADNGKKKPSLIATNEGIAPAAAVISERIPAGVILSSLNVPELVRCLLTGLQHTMRRHAAAASSMSSSALGAVVENVLLLTFGLATAVDDGARVLLTQSPDLPQLLRLVCLSCDVEHVRRSACRRVFESAANIFNKCADPLVRQQAKPARLRLFDYIFQLVISCALPPEALLLQPEERTTTLSSSEYTRETHDDDGVDYSKRTVGKVPGSKNANNREATADALCVNGEQLYSLIAALEAVRSSPHLVFPEIASVHSPGCDRENEEEEEEEDERCGSTDGKDEENAETGTENTSESLENTGDVSFRLQYFSCCNHCGDKTTAAAEPAAAQWYFLKDKKTEGEKRSSPSSSSSSPLRAYCSSAVLIDPLQMSRFFVHRLLSHTSRESFHSTRPDGCLLGLLRVLLVLTCRAGPRLRKQLCRWGLSSSPSSGSRLISFLYGRCLFIVNSNSSSSKSVVDKEKVEVGEGGEARSSIAADDLLPGAAYCQTQQSRQLAYATLFKLCERDSTNLKLLLEVMNAVDTSRNTMSPAGGEKLLLPLQYSRQQQQQLRSTTRNRWNYDPSIFVKDPSASVGLFNQGATCYMNSFLQQLFHIPGFTRRFLAIRGPDNNNSSSSNSSKSNINNYKDEDKMKKALESGDKDSSSSSTTTEDPNDRLLLEMQVMFGFLKLSQRHAFDTLPFCSAFLDYDGEPLRLGEQKDINEFAAMLFDKMENNSECKRLLADSLQGTMVWKTRSTETAYRSEREETFYMISVDVKDKTCLEDSLELAVADELFSGDNKIEDSDTGRKVEALRGCQFRHLPPSLIIHLKRFEFDFETLQRMKVNDYLSFPTVLDMWPYTEEGIAATKASAAAGSAALTSSGNSSSSAATDAAAAAASIVVDEDSADCPTSPTVDWQQQQHNKKEVERKKEKTSTKYVLKGVVVHAGSIDRGHYYSFVDTTRHVPSSSSSSSSTSTWSEFNDRLVSQFDPADIPVECFGGREGQHSGDSGSGSGSGFSSNNSNTAPPPVAVGRMRQNNAYLLVYDRIDIVNMLGEDHQVLSSSTNSSSTEQSYCSRTTAIDLSEVGEELLVVEDSCALGDSRSDAADGNNNNNNGAEEEEGTTTTTTTGRGPTCTRVLQNDSNNTLSVTPHKSTGHPTSVIAPRVLQAVLTENQEFQTDRFLYNLTHFQFMWQMQQMHSVYALQEKARRRGGGDAAAVSGGVENGSDRVLAQLVTACLRFDLDVLVRARAQRSVPLFFERLEEIVMHDSSSGSSSCHAAASAAEAIINQLLLTGPPPPPPSAPSCADIRTTQTTTASAPNISPTKGTADISVDPLTTGAALSTERQQQQQQQHQHHPWLLQMFSLCPHRSASRIFARVILTCIRALRPYHKEKYLSLLTNKTAQPVTQPASTPVKEEEKQKGDTLPMMGLGHGSETTPPTATPTPTHSVPSPPPSSPTPTLTPAYSSSQKSMSVDMTLSPPPPPLRKAPNDLESQNRFESCVSRLVVQLVYMCETVLADEVALVHKKGFEYVTTLLVQIASLGAEETALLIEIGTVYRLVCTVLSINPTANKASAEKIKPCTELIAQLVRESNPAPKSRSSSRSPSSSSSSRSPSPAPFTASLSNHAVLHTETRGTAAAAVLNSTDLQAFLNRVYLENAITVNTTDTAAALEHICWSFGELECLKILEFLVDRVVDFTMSTDHDSGLGSGQDRAAVGRDRDMCTSLQYRAYFKVLSEIIRGPALVDIERYGHIITKLASRAFYIAKRQSTNDAEFVFAVCKLLQRLGTASPAAHLAVMQVRDFWKEISLKYVALSRTQRTKATVK